MFGPFLFSSLHFPVNCLFDLILYITVNNISVMSVRVFLG